MFSYFIGQTYERLYLKQMQRKEIAEFLESLELVRISSASKRRSSERVYLDFDDEEILNDLYHQQDTFIASVVSLQV